MKFTKPERRKQMSYNNAEFVKAWVTSSSLEEVVQKIGGTTSTVSSKATHLRGKGVRLPKMINKISEVDELNKLVKQYSK